MIQRLVRRFGLVRRLRSLATWLEERPFRLRPFVRTDKMVQHDIRRILEPWNSSFNYNAIYCRSSCGTALEKGLDDAVRAGTVKRLTVNGETHYSWNF